jgi:hypothetical protein
MIENEQCMDRTMIPMNAPPEHLLYPNLPNPFSSTTSIPLTRAEPSAVHFSVVDPLGRVTQFIDLGIMSSGSHAMEFHSENLPDGVYIYCMEAGGVQLSRKMLIRRR